MFLSCDTFRKFSLSGRLDHTAPLASCRIGAISTSRYMQYNSPIRMLAHLFSILSNEGFSQLQYRIQARSGSHFQHNVNIRVNTLQNITFLPQVLKEWFGPKHKADGRALHKSSYLFAYFSLICKYMQKKGEFDYGAHHLNGLQLTKAISNQQKCPIKDEIRHCRYSVQLKTKPRFSTGNHIKQ